MSTLPYSDSRASQPPRPLPDPQKQPWEWVVALVSGDERALTIQRQRQRGAIELLKQRSEVSRINPSPDEEWDILEALNETRLLAGRPPLFEADEDRNGSK